MILLVGIPSEPPLAMVGKQLQNRQIPFEFVNQRDVANYSITLECTSSGMGGVMTLGEKEIHLASVTGVYDRATDPTTIPEIGSLNASDPEAMRALRFQDLLSTYLQISSARVVNRLRPMGTNASKPFQAQLIKQFFHVPDTLITNNPIVARDFIKEFEVIYKSVSGERSIVMEIIDEDLERLEELESCPVQFQRKIKGFDCRVHVVGSKIHACSIETDALDYRYAQKKGHKTPKLNPIQLPPEWEEACRGLTQTLGLEFAGIDFVIDADGIPWCLEVNTCPAYSYFEVETGQPIAASLANHLAGIADEGEH